MITKNENNPNLLPPSYFKKQNQKIPGSPRIVEITNVLERKIYKKPKSEKINKINKIEPVINSQNKLFYCKSNDLIDKLFELKDSQMRIEKSFTI